MSRSLEGSPADIATLLQRAAALVGISLGELARDLGVRVTGDARKTKGSGGSLLERALGATGGSAAVHDFPDLGVELKTLPVDTAGRPLESTYVCTLNLANSDALEWETSWVRSKLACVLLVPLLDGGGPWFERTVAQALLWVPTASQDEILRADFDDIVGLVGVGRVEELNGYMGRVLQVRPKAAHGRVRTFAFGPDGEAIATVPRGFYLRPHFTGALLRDPSSAGRLVCAT